MLTDTREEAEKWFNVLKRSALVVLRHASTTYAFGNMIGKGNYAKVHMATHKVTGEKVAIKSINKSRLMDNDRTIVQCICSQS